MFASFNYGRRQLDTVGEQSAVGRMQFGSGPKIMSVVGRINWTSK